jgi:hypothetical protein
MRVLHGWRGVLAWCVVAGVSLASGAVAARAEGTSLSEWDPTGRRDPFEFRSAEPDTGRDDERGRRMNEEGKRRNENEGADPRPPERTLTDLLRESSALLDGSARRFGARDYALVEEDAGRLLRGLDRAQHDDPLLRERLAALRDAAARLRRVRESEQDFARLNIVVQGIVWSPDAAVALVNGTAVREGESVGDARVEEIRRGEVIFVYRNVRIAVAP